jgi:divalent metal cation (Fe/Co/Zn/Cd) transporter
MITTRTFRMILLLLIACTLTSTISVVLSRHTLPPEIQSYKRAVVAEKRKSGNLELRARIDIVVLLAYAIAIIGLFSLKPFARPLFTVVVVAMIIWSLSFGLRIEARLVAAFSDAGSLLDGIIIALLYWSPIREKFIRPMNKQ